MPHHNIEFDLPPRVEKNDGTPRMVGVELALSGISIDQTAKVKPMVRGLREVGAMGAEKLLIAAYGVRIKYGDPAPRDRGAVFVSARLRRPAVVAVIGSGLPIDG